VVLRSEQVTTDSEEIQYQSLRFWFLDHQIRFVPLWKDFYECQEWASHEDYNNKDIADLEDIDKYFQNPFLFFYKPENLFQLNMIILVLSLAVEG